jgi:hypothetical protein
MPDTEVAQYGYAPVFSDTILHQYTTAAVRTVRAEVVSYEPRQVGPCGVHNDIQVGIVHGFY